MTPDPADMPEGDPTDTPPSSERRYSPAGASRERPIPCLECGDDTWNVDGVCDACHRLRHGGAQR